MSDHKHEHDHDHKHKHEHEHGCCGQDHDHECCEHGHEQEMDWIELEDDEGKTHKFLVDSLFEMDEKQYAILLSEDQVEVEEPEFFVLRIDQDEDGNDVLVDLDEEEFARVCEAIDEETDEIEADDDEEFGTEEE